MIEYDIVRAIRVGGWPNDLRRADYSQLIVPPPYTHVTRGLKLASNLVQVSHVAPFPAY